MVARRALLAAPLLALPARAQAWPARSVRIERSWNSRGVGGVSPPRTRFRIAAGDSRYAELNAREKLIEADAPKLFDKIGRAYGILQNCHQLSSSEAMNLLSLLRLGIDLGLFPEPIRAVTDRLLIEAQPGHIQAAARHDLDSVQRDALRADKIRNEFAAVARPDFTLHTKE
jgi:hypothetical protein